MTRSDYAHEEATCAHDSPRERRPSDKAASAPWNLRAVWTLRSNSTSQAAHMRAEPTKRQSNASIRRSNS